MAGLFSASKNLNSEFSIAPLHPHLPSHSVASLLGSYFELIHLQYKSLKRHWALGFWCYKK